MHRFEISWLATDATTHLAVLEEVAHRSPTTLHEKLIEIGGRMVHHARWVGCQLAEVAVLREQFAKTPRRIYGRSRSPA
jgi:hypothetical protein